MILGKCPICNANVISIKTIIKDKKVKLYTCENTKKEYDESESFVFSSDSTCTYRVYSNVFLKWNKKSLSEYEMKKILNNDECIVRLYSKKAKKEYFKYAVLDKEYGVSILFDEEVCKD